MAKLAAFLASFFANLVGWFSAYLGSRAGLFIAVVAVTLSCTTALFVALKALVGLLLLPGIVSVVAEPFVMSFYACWPSNAETCVSIIFGSDMLVFLYKYRLRLIALAA